MRRNRHIIIALVLAMVPSLALANALIPAVNAYRNTPAFYFVFCAIILIEGICIRLCIRRMHIASVLWRVVVLNLASSFAGYLLMRSPLRPGFVYVWQQAIPFFILTLAAELPLFLVLFKRPSLSWKQKLFIGTLANVLSYAFLIVAERPVEAVWLHRLSAADQRTLGQWVDFGMLSDCTGQIYGTESEGHHRTPPHRLRYFDLPTNGDHPLTHADRIGVTHFEVGEVLALDLDNGYFRLRIRSHPFGIEFTPVLQLDRDLVGIPDNVVVRQNVAVFADQKT